MKCLKTLLTPRLLLFAVAFCLSALPAASKPNIIVIVADDMEDGLVEHMPTLKAEVIAKGATFSRAYFNDPLCCPSRAAMLTGKYVQNNKTTDQSHSQFYNAGNPDRTVAVWLDAAGYRTALTGKYLNGYPSPRTGSYVPPGWDYWAGKRGGELYYDYTLNENGATVSYGAEPGDYSTDVYKAKALTFIEAALAAEEPFFLWFSPSAPHAPHTPAQRHAGLYPGLTAPKPGNFNEADVGDKPAYVRAQPPLTASQVRGVDANYRKRVQSLRAVDEALRAFVAELDEAGQLPNTYIVFVSDNGWSYGQHRLRTKGFPYEEVVRMPLYVRGPGVPAGSSIAELVGNIDLAPTFAEWAGATPNATLDGRSFAPLAAGRSPSWREVLPLYYKEGSGPGYIPGWRGLRTRDYAYTEYDTGEREFYDMLGDPLQLVNKAASLSPSRRDRLSSLARSLGACAGDRCRQLDAQAP